MTLGELYDRVRKNEPSSSFSFGERLRMLRDLKGANAQREIASAIGISASTFSYYESGMRMPNTEPLVKIAKFYDVSTDWLLGLSEEMERR